MRADVIIRGGRVFDGGDRSFLADIAIKDGVIIDIQKTIESDADQIIAAEGLWVTPGFVDIHTHYDLEVEIDAGLCESVRHGVTTVVMGGCSLSLAYGEAADLAAIISRVETLPPQTVEAWLQKAKAWPDARAYYAHLANLPLGPNVASMLGHSALRVKVMGLESSLKNEATADQIKAMQDLAQKGLEAGAIGISVDMVHWHRVSGKYAGSSLPSHHASYEEYKALAEICRARDAVFQSTPNPENPASFFNILRLSPGFFRAPLRHTVLSALDMDLMKPFWHVYGFILFIFNGLLGCNLRFQTLCEPFTIYSDGHLTPFFEEFPEGVRLNNATSVDDRRRLYDDPAFRADFIKSWTTQWPRTFHRDLARIEIVDATNKALIGRTIADVACERDKPAPETFLDLLRDHDEGLRWKGCGANMRPHILRKLIKNPYIFPGFSDAGAHGRNLAFFDNATSFLRQVIPTRTMTPEAAIKRLTSEPAAWFNLETGRIGKGLRADLVVLDPARLSDPIPEPKMVADRVLDGAPRLVKRDDGGVIRSVLIAGKLAINDGEPTEILGKQRLGQLLTQKNPATSATMALKRFRNRFDESLTGAEAQSYWEVFLLKHQNPYNLACHMVGFVLMYAVPIAAWAWHSALILLLWPTSQLTGIIGHRLFERSPIDQRDAVFSPRAFVSLHRMFFLCLTGGYGRAAQAAKARYMGEHYRSEGVGH